jgi:hypothetical protein
MNEVKQRMKDMKNEFKKDTEMMKNSNLKTWK